MASSSEKTLPSSDSKDENKSSSPAVRFDALDFPGMAALVDYDRMLKELGEKMVTDPAYIQISEQFRSSMQHGSSREFNQEQLSELEKMRLRLRNNMLQISLESLGKPGALEQFAERVEQMRKDPEVEPILAEIDAHGAAALLKFSDDKKVLGKLGKSMISALGDVEGLKYDEEELVSEGRKALKIVSGYAQMKCYKVLLENRRKKANGVDRKKKTASHHAAKSGRTKRTSLKGDVAATSSMC